MPGTINPLLLAPIFVPLGCAALALIFARIRLLPKALALFAGGVAWLCSVQILSANLTTGVQIYRIGGWPTPYGIVLAGDMLSAALAVMATTVIGAGIIYVVGCKDKCIEFPVFIPLFLCMAAGMNGALYTGDIFTLFVFIELMAMASMILVALSDNRLGLEAAIKYLLISALGSLFLLMGIGALYTTFGTLTMADIARLLATGQRPLLSTAAGVMLMCAFMLKSAVFPFHFWQPDLYTTAPTPVSAMLSAIGGKIGVYGLIRIVTLMFTIEARLIGDLLVVLGVIGIFFGSLAALRTHDAKRLLAYSTFGQIGFILVGIGWNTPLALIGAIVYMVNHAFIKSSLLLITGAVASRTTIKTARLSDLGGVGKVMPVSSALYFLGALSLAGVPPLNGFISKVGLVQGGIQAEEWLVLFLVVGAGVLTLVYMTRTWQHIFQRAPDDNSAKLKPTGDMVLAPALLIGLCVVLGLYATPLVDLASRVVAQIGDPQIYIRAILGGG